MKHATAARVAGLACAVLTLGMPAGPSGLGDVQQAMEALARTPGVVGAIGEAYVDGKRVGRQPGSPSGSSRLSG